MKETIFVERGVSFWDLWLLPRLDIFAGLKNEDDIPGNSPEFMPWDNSLNKDLDDAMDFHCALTAHLPKDDRRKFSCSTPERTAYGYQRLLAGIAISSERIIQDCERVLTSMLVFFEADGIFMPGLANHTGHREIRRGGHGGACTRRTDEKILAAGIYVNPDTLLAFNG